MPWGAPGRRSALPTAVAALVLACSSPPRSQFPSAAAAFERMHAGYRCSRGLRGEAQLDYFHAGGRARGEAQFLLSRPDRLRFDILSPFGVPLSTVASDGRGFALLDLEERVYLRGSAQQCNLERFIQIPVPPEALVRLLSGEAPVLVHDPAQATLSWESGRYRIRVRGLHEAEELIELEPHPDDWNRPYGEQRVRVRVVEVRQRDYVLYRAEFDDFESAKTAAPRVDPDGLFAAVPPSGPECRAEIPRSMRFRIADGSRDLSFDHRKVEHNPPLLESVFQVSPPGGVRIETSRCSP